MIVATRALFRDIGQRVGTKAGGKLSPRELNLCEGAARAAWRLAMKEATKQSNTLRSGLLEMLDIYMCPTSDPGCPDCIRVRAIRLSIGLPENREAP